MSEEKRDGAMRIFEALSAVDEELLERSETQRTPILSFWYRHSKGLAAAVCIAVLGVSAWSVTTIFSPMGAMKPQDNLAADSVVPQVSERKAESADAETAREAAKQYDRTEPKAGETWENAPGEGMQEMAPEAIKEAAEEKEEQQGGITIDEANGGNAIKELTEAEARETAVVGAYIPTSFPEGYVFDAARGGSLGEQHDLFVCYSRGIDEITLSFSTEEEELLDFNDTENPIYYAEALTPELIASRMKICEDKGDTSTPRGNFAVYYKKDGVYVRFNGRGSAEEISEMFASVRP